MVHTSMWYLHISISLNISILILQQKLSKSKRCLFNPILKLISFTNFCKILIIGLRESQGYNYNYNHLLFFFKGETHTPNQICFYNNLYYACKILAKKKERTLLIYRQVIKHQKS